MTEDADLCARLRAAADFEHDERLASRELFAEAADAIERLLSLDEMWRRKEAARAAPTRGDKDAD
jgi:hypothetical protein